jgi:carbonic anhydrase/acetyltransferase-like protein (isoleucine patch superfamily)
MPGPRSAKALESDPTVWSGRPFQLDDAVTLKAHVVVDGRTTIGARTTIYPFASIGSAPQDLKYNEEPSQLIIGKNNTIREHVTMNPGTAGGGLRTVIGNNCLFMVGTHVAHDCVIGDHVIMANNATLGGHVRVGDRVVIGGLAAVHQFIRIGSFAVIGGTSGVESDVIPFENGTLEERVQELEEDFATDGNIRQIIQFCEKGIGSGCASRSARSHEGKCRLGFDHAAARRTDGRPAHWQLLRSWLKPGHFRSVDRACLLPQRIGKVANGRWSCAHDYVPATNHRNAVSRLSS